MNINPQDFESWGRALMKDYEKKEEVSNEPIYKLSSNERKIVKAVEKTHPQLSPLLIMMGSVVLGRGGLLVIMPKGGGKTVACKSIAKRFGGLEMDALDDNLEGWSNKSITLILHDLVTTVVSKEDTFRIITPLIYDKSISMGKVVVKDVDLAVISAGVPLVLKELMARDLYEGALEDRLLRLFYLYYEKPNLISSNIPEFPDLRWGSGSEWKVSPSKFEECRSLLEGQFTEERAYLFATRLLKGHSILCNRDVVEDKDVNWLLTYSPFIKIDSYCNIRMGSKERRWAWTRIQPIINFAEAIYHITKVGRIEKDRLRKKLRTRRRSLNSMLSQLEPVGVKWDTSEVWLEGWLKAELERVYNTFT